MTEYVLAKLEEFGAKATFFCIGDNVRKHPDIFQMLLTSGQSIGNHTYNHLNGWKTDDEIYMENIARCDEQLNVSTNLFRPPYGRMKKSQARFFSTDRKIIMWDVLSGDFSPKITPETCLEKSIKYTKPGSIILFHDSLKAKKNMTYTLPLFLEHFTKQGYGFEAIPMI